MLTEERSTYESDKPSMDDDAKNEIGETIGILLSQYKNNRLLREAEIPVTITIFEPKSASSKKGFLVVLSGLIESIDMNGMSQKIMLEGRKIKLSEIVSMELPSDLFEESYDDGEGSAEDDRDPDDDQRVPDDRRNKQTTLTDREIEALERDMERQLRAEQDRETERQRGLSRRAQFSGDDLPIDGDPFPDYYSDIPNKPKQEKKERDPDDPPRYREKRKSDEKRKTPKKK